MVDLVDFLREPVQDEGISCPTEAYRPPHDSPASPYHTISPERDPC